MAACGPLRRSRDHMISPSRWVSGEGAAAYFEFAARPLNLPFSTIRPRGERVTAAGGDSTANS
jgi:hypothetical protein